MSKFLVLIKVKRKFFSLINIARAKMTVTIHGVILGEKVSITSPPYIFRHSGSKIFISDHVRIHGSLYNNPVCSGHKMVLATYSSSAVIEIGEGAAISCATIAAYKKITIGKRVFIGAGAQIMDTDFHPIYSTDRLKKNQMDIAESEPVVIQDDVWLGAESMVLKGVTVGQGAVVAARAVVTKDVPAHALVAGIPAKVVRMLEVEEN